MSDIATRLRQCAADIRRTPVRLDTWIPLQQEAADTIDALRAEVERLRALIKRARPYVQAYAAITRTDEVSLDASETAEAMRLSGPT